MFLINSWILGMPSFLYIYYFDTYFYIFI